MKAKFLLLFFLTIYEIGQAQDRMQVKGKISSRVNPVPGATVQIAGTTIGAVADHNGKYVLKDVTPGTIKLIFRSIGYHSHTRKVNVVPGKDLLLDVRLEENNLGLDEVVVTGTMKPTFVSASPIKVDVITAQHLNTYLPAAASSVIEGIKLVNGVQEVVACGVCFTNSISINGLPGPYTAVLMDGTPMYGNLASVYGLNGIPNMIIDRIEVIKGPSSTLYGSEAVAGVINIITKDPAKQPLLSVDIMGTSHLESFGNVAAAPNIGKSHGFIGFNYAYINDFDDDNKDGFGDLANLDRYSFFTKWNIYRKSDKKFTAAAKYYYEDRRNGVEKYLENRNYRHLRGNDSIYGESIYTDRIEVFGSYELNSAENLKIDYSLSSHWQDSYYGADFYEATQQIAFANFIWDKPVQHHGLMIGLTTRYQSYDDNTIATAGPKTNGALENKPDHQLIPGIFVQDEWTVSEAVTILGGGRLDHYSAHGLIFSPRLNLKVKPGNWTTLRASFGTGFRIVNLFTEDHAFITGQRTVEIKETLHPERSYNAALNFNYVFTLGNSQGMIDIDSYYTYFTNKIIPDYDLPGKIIYENTDGHAVTKGIGLNFTQDFLFPLTYNLGFNLQNVVEKVPGEFGTNQTSPVEFAPRWSGIFSANYRWKKPKITFAYTLKITGPMALPEVYDLDENGTPLAIPRPVHSESFAFQTIQISKEFSAKLGIYAGIQNLFNYTQQLSPLTGYNDPAAPPGFSDYFDTAYAFSPIHGREFYIGVKWNLEKK